MEKGTFIKLVGQRLAGRDYQDMAEFIDSEMELVQTSILEGGDFLPWFLEAEAQVVVPEGAGVLELPEGFIRPDTSKGLFLDTDLGPQELLQYDWNSMQKDTGESVGMPCGFALVGGGWRVGPVPDREYSGTWWYMKKDVPPSQITDDESNAWLSYAANVMVAEVGKVCAGVLRDGDAYKMFADQGLRAWADLKQADSERRFNSQELYFFGGN